MKTKMFVLAAVAASLVTTASAQVEVTITGSTAFRSIVQDRIQSLYDGGFTNTAYAADANNIRTYTGTMNSVFTPGTLVTVRLSWSGSATGMQAVKNGTPVNTASSTNTLVSKTPDIAFSDVFPSSANPTIANNAFASVAKVGVVPFVFVRNNQPGNIFAGVSNITRDQALLLMTAGGSMPPSYLGGTDTVNPLYLVGRDSGSGTRITTEKCINFKGTPFLYAKSTGGAWIGTNGFSSGSTVAAVVSTNLDAIGYLGLADYATISNNATALSFNGVPYSTANVLSGKYAVWGYQHMCARIGLSTSQATLRTRLFNAITDTTYQHNNANYVGKFEAIADMQVDRGADGGTIASTQF